MNSLVGTPDHLASAGHMSAHDSPHRRVVGVLLSRPPHDRRDQIRVPLAEPVGRSPLPLELLDDLLRRQVQVNLCRPESVVAG